MILPILGLVIGVVIGLCSPFVFPVSFMPYVAIGILACTDSVLGGLRAHLTRNFNLSIFISGFFGNALISVLLIWLGNKLNIQLSTAAIVVYGSRVFQNFGFLRRYIFNQQEK